MTLELSGDITIARSHEIKAQLMAALAKGEPITADLRGATSIDMAGLQLLLAARISASANGRAFSFPKDKCADMVLRSAQLSGLAESLGMTEASHG